MSNFTLYFIVYLFEMLISYIVFSTVSERKHNVFTILAIGLLVFEGGAIINILFSNTIWVNSIYTVLSTYLFAVLFFHIKYRSAAVYVILMSIFSAAFEFATIFAVSVVTGMKIADYDSNLSLLLMQAAVSKTLYLIACITLIHFQRRKESVDNLPISFYFFPVCVVFTLIAFWYISARESLSDTNQLLLAVISIVLLGATVLMYITYRHSIEKDIEYIQVKNENDRLQTEKAHYDILERQNQQLMIYAHDTKNHLAAIQNLSTDSAIDGYIKTLLEQLHEYTANCHSGNKILDVIINKYITESDIRGIKFDFDVRSCALNRVDDIDLVSILGNLLDNALTAAEQSEEKYISFETTTRNSYNVVIISNSCDHEPKSREASLLTTKENKKLHGFGIKSVKKTLKKYCGDYNWDYDEAQHRFVATVMIGK